MKKSFLALALLALVFTTIFSACKKTENGPVTFRRGSALDELEDSKEKDEEKEETDGKDVIYIVSELNMFEETISLYAIDSGRTVQYRYSLSTKFLNKYGNSSSWANFTPGTAVTVTKDKKKSVLEKVEMSDEVWTQDDVTNFSFDEEQMKMEIGSTPYHYTFGTQVYSGNDITTISAISEDDTLNVVGLDKKIISISITTGHGYIQLLNEDPFIGSMISIGDKIFTEIYNDMVIEVPEGEYEVTVANAGLGGTKTVTVTRNEITTLDLGEYQAEGEKICKLKFTTSVSNVTVMLDGKKVKANKNIKVPYGVHTISVSATGYDNWERTLYVNSPSAIISVDFSDEGSGSSSNSSSSSSSNSSNSSSNSSSGSSNSSSSSSSDSSSSSKTDSEKDYLSTISDMISLISGSNSSDSD